MALEFQTWDTTVHGLNVVEKSITLDTYVLTATPELLINSNHVRLGNNLLVLYPLLVVRTTTGEDKPR